jgi:hypothetical protein
VLEALLALGILTGFGGVSLLLTAGPESVLLAGLWLIAGGLAFGIPTGLVYHLELRRSLARVGALPARWWLHPTALHDRVPPRDRRRVLGWCGAGALGFAVTLAGILVVTAAALRLV